MKTSSMLVLFTMLLAGFPMDSRAQSSFYVANLSGGQVSPPFGSGGDPVGSPFTGTASLVFTPGDGGGSPTLSYEIVLPGMDLDGSLTPAILGDDVTAIHIHFGAPGMNGPHGLNILGLSGGQIREDDADLVVDLASHTIAGIWDDGDQLFTGPGGTKLAPDSAPLSDAVADLMSGNLYIQVHTLNFSSGELRGQISPVPEPGSLMLVLLGAGLFCCLRQTRD